MNKYQTILNMEYQGRLWIFFGLILLVFIMIVFLVVITQKISDKKERKILFGTFWTGVWNYGIKSAC